MSHFYEVWCDGSYRKRGSLLGTAWVAISPFGERQDGSRTLPRLQDSHNHGSDIAELSAFIDALDIIPDDSHVRVHMDCRNVIEWVSSGKLSNANKMREPRVRKTFEDAVRAKKRMRHVEIVLASDKTSEHMGWAHILSRRATAPEDKLERHAYQNPQQAARPRHP